MNSLQLLIVISTKRWIHPFHMTQPFFREDDLEEFQDRSLFAYQVSREEDSLTSLCNSFEEENLHKSHRCSANPS